MALPHYLTSGASSRAHYALLRRLDAAPTLAAADDAVAEEVERCRGVLAASVSPRLPPRVVAGVLVLFPLPPCALIALPFVGCENASSNPAQRNGALRTALR